MTYNEKTRTLKLKRKDVCDILLALGLLSTAGEKWNKLYEKVREQLDIQDDKDPCEI